MGFYLYKDNIPISNCYQSWTWTCGLFTLVVKSWWNFANYLGSNLAEFWNYLQQLISVTEADPACKWIDTLFILLWSLSFFLIFLQGQYSTDYHSMVWSAWLGLSSLKMTVLLPLVWSTWSRAWGTARTCPHVSGTVPLSAWRVGKDFSVCMASKLFDAMSSWNCLNYIEKTWASEVIFLRLIHCMIPETWLLLQVRI